MIHIENLSYTYPGAHEEALHDIQLSICKGALLGLIGPNGAGKTTLISLLTGALKHSRGTITIGDYQLPKHLNQAKQLIGYIPQDYAFYPNLTALENLQFFAGIQGIASSIQRQRIDFCLEFCQLQHVLSQRAASFSGGLKRRLNIAIGLLTDPEILFFDEPTVSIDPQSRSFILQQIKLLHEQGKTIIYTSHYMEEVEQLCDHLAIIDHGKLLKHGTLQTLQAEQQKKLVIELQHAVDNEDLQQLLGKYQASFKHNQLVFSNISDISAYNNILNQVEMINLPVASVFYGKNNLEQVFLELTSRQLRD